MVRKMREKCDRCSSFLTVPLPDTVKEPLREISKLDIWA